MSVWTWLMGLLALVLLTGTKGAVRGGIVVLLLTLLTARVAYLWMSGGQW